MELDGIETVVEQVAGGNAGGVNSHVEGLETLHVNVGDGDLHGLGCAVELNAPVLANGLVTGNAVVSILWRGADELVRLGVEEVELELLLSAVFFVGLEVVRFTSEGSHDVETALLELAAGFLGLGVELLAEGGEFARELHDFRGGGIACFGGESLVLLADFMHQAADIFEGFGELHDFF